MQSFTSAVIALALVQSVVSVPLDNSDLPPPVVPEPRATTSLPPPVVPEPRQSSGCYYDYTFPSIGSAAAIQSPNYPGSYPPYTDCKYILRAPVGSIITMDCDDFNVEFSTGCAYDYFIFSIFGDLALKDVARACGQGSINGQKSTGNIMTIGFKSDEANPYATTPYRYQCVVRAVADPAVAPTTTKAPLTTTKAPLTTTKAPLTTTKAPLTTTKAPLTTTKAPVTSTTASSSTCSCGERNEIPRIVGGADAEVNEFPWRCNLYAPSMGVFCGATLISNSWVLTAAHCTNAIPAGTTYYVDCGDHDISSATESENSVVKVVQTIQHASYNSNTQDNDVSLLKLEYPLTFSREIQPICLPYNMVGKNLTGTTITASGWGTLTSGGSQPYKLQKVDLPVLTTKECQQYYGTAVTNNMICTYSPGKDTCQGDSGGSIDYKDPVTGRYSNIGVVSWGVGCAETRKPGVYANTMNYLSWIEAKTGETFCKP